MKRLTIAEAARELGVTQDVIKRRITMLELVACQAPEYRECVWIQESSGQVSSGSRVMEREQQDRPMVEEDIQGESRPPQSATLLELKRQVVALQKRIEELESLESLEGSSTRVSQE